MESFVTSYGLPFAAFQELLQTTNSVVAGSAALALYLAENGIDPGYEPGDMDIWVEDTQQLVAARGNYVQYGNLYLFTNFLIKNNFNLSTKFEPKEDYETLHNITNILSFVNREGKEIQVIMMKECDIHNYIFHNFDLTPCMTWWNARENVFESMWPGETLQKEMYYQLSHEMNEREIARIEKYKERGFQLLEKPCPAIGRRDTRFDLGCLAGQTAFDLFAYEEVDCVTFLQSSWHVLLRVGEQFQAFHRTTLHDYLKGHVCHHHYLQELYDTPHKQTILHASMTWVNWSDYSIVELVPAYTIPYENTTKSIYECHFYTIKDWKERRAGLILTIPSKEAMENAPLPNMPVPDIPLNLYEMYWMDG